MGWLYMAGMRGHKTPKQYLDAQFTHSGENYSNRVVKSAAKLNVWYAAVESIEKVTGKQSVFAAVCLYRYNLRDKEGMIFGYKDMDESMGPCERQCPTAILDLLTETDSQWANEWRADCRKYAALRMPRAGEAIRLAHPLRFTDGRELDTFVATMWTKNKMRFMAVGQFGLFGPYRISRLKGREFAVFPGMVKG